VIEGSRSGSGSIPLTDGSGSGSRRSKNMGINTGGSILVINNIGEYIMNFKTKLKKELLEGI
jgi:hypothetical protein